MGLMIHDLHREYLRQMRTGEVRRWEDVPTDEEYALLCAGTVREDAGRRVHAGQHGLFRQLLRHDREGVRQAGGRGEIP